MYSYSVKVRTKAYLWGSDGVTKALTAPLLLIVHNDPWGDPIGLVSDSVSGDTDLGTLRPGECWTVPLVALKGVFATCDADSSVTCMIVAPQVLSAN